MLIVAGIVPAAIVLAPIPAFADKLDSTLDIAATSTSSLLRGGGDLPGQWFATGLVERIGLTFHGLRLGGSFGFLGVPSDATKPATIWGVPFELSAGWAFGRARPHPYVELRASAIHLFSSTDHGVPSTWAFSLVPRVGMRIPIGDFFLEAGVGVGIGAERFQMSWSFGFPIPTANL